MTDRSYLSIGDVLALLRDEFPDITISKIRFLESRGLLDPERTPSGYRKFYEADVERLRWILRQQREHFLPLKIIKGRLEGGPAAVEEAPSLFDAGGVAAPEHAASRALVGAIASLRPAGAGGPDPAAGPWAREGGGDVPLHRRGQRAEPFREPATGGFGGEGASRAEPGRRRGGPAGAASDRGPATREVAPPTRSTFPGGDDEIELATIAPLAAADEESALETAAAAAAASEAARPDAERPEPEEAPGGHTVDGEAAATPASEGRRRAGEVPAGGSRRAARAAAGALTPPRGTAEDTPEPPAGKAGKGKGRRARTLESGASFTPAELADASGLEVADVERLEEFGLLTSRLVAGVRCYDEEGLVVARLAAGFARYGVEPRHLRTFKHAADREAGLFEQVVIPLLRQRNPEARSRATEALEELTELGAALQASLLGMALRDVTG